MELSRWSVENYRSIGSVEFEVGSLSVLIGKNNSGKSNISESIIEYFNTIGGRIHQGLTWTDTAVREKDAKRNIVFDATFSLTHEESEIVAEEISENNHFNIAKESLLKTGRTSKLRHRVILSKQEVIKEDVSFGYKEQWIPYSFRNPEDPREIKLAAEVEEDLFSISDPDLLYSYDLENFKQTQPRSSRIGDLMPDSCRNWTKEFCQSVEEVGAIRRPKSSKSVSVNKKLREDAENLTTVLHTLSQNDREKYERIAARYVSIMEGVEDLRTPISGNAPDTTIEVLESDSSYKLDEISSGSMEILSLLTKLVLAEDSTSLLIIEEPELHLHPEAEREILDMMREVSNQGPQILITTHSKVFVDSTKAKQIIKVVRGDSTKCKKIDRVEEELEDLGYSKSEFLQSNAVVFVEGKSDERVIKNLAQKSGFNPTELGIHFVELDGEGNIRSDGRSLVKLLYSFDIPYLFVADSHDDDPAELTDEIVEAINSRDGDWYTTPGHFAILSGYGIEDYLIEMPHAIASVVDANVDEISSEKENSETDSSFEVLNRIFQKHLDTDYNKSEHGMLIAKHGDKSEIPREMADLLDQIRKLPKGK